MSSSKSTIPSTQFLLPTRILEGPIKITLRTVSNSTRGTSRKAYPALADSHRNPTLRRCHFTGVFCQFNSHPTSCTYIQEDPRWSRKHLSKHLVLVRRNDFALPREREKHLVLVNRSPPSLALHRTPRKLARGSFNRTSDLME